MSTHGRTHWIKLYVEMIDDPKVGILPDAIKWRWVSALLLAGELNEDGFLPDVNDMAWRLHTNVETLQGEMRTIAGRGLVELKEHPDGSERWFIKAFAKRQAPATGTERSRMSRHRARQGSSNDTPDDTQRNVASSLHKQKQKQNTETVIEGERGRTPTQEPAMYSQAHSAVRAMQEVTTYWPGEVTHPIIIEKLGDAPDVRTLGRAYQLWMTNGNNPRNYAGICDWYNELRRDPNWTPQARFKNGKATTAAAPVPVMKEVAPGLY